MITDDDIKQLYCVNNGAEDRARTGHPDLGKVVLYQMSYFRIIFRERLYWPPHHPCFDFGMAKILIS
jgi:hypothetical protein